MMNMETILQRLMAIEGVTGAMLVGKDGLVVASTMEGDAEEILGAMAAAAFDAAGRYIGQLGMGDVRHTIFETRSGTVQVTDGGDLLIVARSSHAANLGRIRMEAQHASVLLAEQVNAY
jgi:predicted regulator of Ras-like GTPase activity (Roadblock/LC7/MglB family)